MIDLMKLGLKAQGESIKNQQYFDYVSRKIKKQNDYWKQFNKHMGNFGMPKFTDSKRSYVERFMSFEYKKEDL